MLIEEIRKIEGSKKQLREFGVIAAILFLILCKMSIYFLAMSLVLLFLGVFRPSSLRKAYKIWMSLALVLGMVVTGVILGGLFYLVLTPIGMISRIRGGDFLGLKLDKKRGTYWLARKKTAFDKSRYEKQY